MRPRFRRSAPRRGPLGPPASPPPRQARALLAAGRRLEHLRDDGARSARQISTAVMLHFRGGTGSCVIDDYVTDVGAHRFYEIACLVEGGGTGSVVVAATPPRRLGALWTASGASGGQLLGRLTRLGTPFYFPLSHRRGLPDFAPLRLCSSHLLLFLFEE